MNLTCGRLARQQGIGSRGQSTILSQDSLWYRHTELWDGYDGGCDGALIGAVRAKITILSHMSIFFFVCPFLMNSPRSGCDRGLTFWKDIPGRRCFGGLSRIGGCRSVAAQSPPLCSLCRNSQAVDISTSCAHNETNQITRVESLFVSPFLHRPYFIPFLFTLWRCIHKCSVAGHLSKPMVLSYNID